MASERGADHLVAGEPRRVGEAAAPGEHGGPEGEDNRDDVDAIGRGASVGQDVAQHPANAELIEVAHEGDETAPATDGLVGVGDRQSLGRPEIRMLRVHRPVPSFSWSSGPLSQRYETSVQDDAS
ncbi:MAG: hypothetical protein U0610_28955 [bacterium]